MNIKITLSAAYVFCVLLDIQITNFRVVMYYFIPVHSGDTILSNSVGFLVWFSFVFFFNHVMILRFLRFVKTKLIKCI